MIDANRSPAKRRYDRRVVATMALYVAALFGAELVIKRGLAPPLTYAVAVLPALPLLGLIVAMGRYLAEETDEYQRSLMVDASLWATGITLAVATVWGFLEALAAVPHVPLYFAFILWLGSLGVVRCVRGWVAR